MSNSHASRMSETRREATSKDASDLSGLPSGTDLLASFSKALEAPASFSSDPFANFSKCHELQSSGNLPKDCRLSVIEKRTKILEAARRLNEESSGRTLRSASPYAQVKRLMSSHHQPRLKSVHSSLPSNSSILPSSSSSQRPSGPAVLVEFIPPYENGQKYEIVSKQSIPDEKTEGEIVDYVSSKDGHSKRGVYLGQFDSRLAASRALANRINSAKPQGSSVPSISAVTLGAIGTKNSLDPMEALGSKSSTLPSLMPVSISPPKPSLPLLPLASSPPSSNQMDRVLEELDQIKSMLSTVMRNHDELMSLLRAKPKPLNKELLKEMPRLPPAGVEGVNQLDDEPKEDEPSEVGADSVMLFALAPSMDEAEEQPPNIKREPMEDEDGGDEPPPQIDVYAT